MNKRKPDDEFARINLSFFAVNGNEVTVFCPESAQARATQQPLRRSLATAPGALPIDRRPTTVPTTDPASAAPAASAAVEVAVGAARAPGMAVLKEQHFTIFYGDTGHSYESILGPYLEGARRVQVEDPYIRLPHQIQNFVRFCETVVKHASVKQITLRTGYDQETPLADIQDKLNELKQSLLELDVILEVELNPHLHDREIRLDNGWVIKIGRGLDFYQKPGSWFELGANDLSLRKCLETKVDIFRVGTTGE